MADQKLQIALELERRALASGKPLPDDVRSYLNAARAQGAAKPLVDAGTGTPGGGAAVKGKASLGAIDALTRQLIDVESRYSRDLKGGIGVTEYLPTPTNKAFDSAAAGLSDQALAAFRVPGVGAQSDRELASFVAANQPSASDYDEQIEQKLKNIKVRIDGRRRGLGLEPIDGTNPELSLSGQAREPATPNPVVQSLAPTNGVTRTEAVGGEIDTTTGKELAAMLANGQIKTVGEAMAFARGRGANFDEASITRYLDYYKKGGRGTPAVAAENRVINREGEGATAAALRGVGDTLTFGFLDELGAGVDTAAQLWNEGAGGRSIGDIYSSNVDTNRAILRGDAERDPGARLVGQLAGGFAIPAGAAGRLGGLTARQAATRAGAYGAATGGLYGFGSGEGGVSDRVPNALTGAAIGGGLGAGLGAGGAALAARRGGGGSGGGGGGGGVISGVDQGLLDAGARQGVDILPADALGPMTRRFTSAAAQAPLSAGPIIRAGQWVLDQSAAARDRAAASVGTAAADLEGVGDAAIRGGLSYRNRTSAHGGKLYDEAARLAGEARIDPAQARAVLDRNIAELSEVPGGADGLAQLASLRESLNGDFTVNGVRNMRTTLRDKFLKDGLRGSDLERRVNQVVEAASQDVTNSLNSAGKGEAARAYKAADDYWRQRLQTIDQVLEPIIGNGSDRTADQVATAIRNASRNNSQRFDAFVKALPEDEAQIVRSTLISQLGKASNGAQNDTNTAFSLAQFLTQWNQLPARSKSVIAGGEARAALDDLAKIADASKQAARYANSSNTGSAITGNVAAIGAAAWANPLLAVGAAGAQYLTGRTLASPRFVRAVVGIGKARTRSAALARTARLSTLAQRDPALSQDALGFQRAVMDALNASPGRAAAGEQENQ